MGFWENIFELAETPIYWRKKFQMRDILPRRNAPDKSMVPSCDLREHSSMMLAVLVNNSHAVPSWRSQAIDWNSLQLLFLNNSSHH